jgi:hypothetical protein
MSFEFMLAVFCGGISMRNAIARWIVGIGCCLFAIATLGCGSSESGVAVTQANEAAAEPHDHEEPGDHKHGEDSHGPEGGGHAAHGGHAHGEAGSGGPPADFASTVAELRPLYETIRDAFQAGDKDKAHEPLHQIGHLLEALPESASMAGFGDQELATAKSASAAMFKAYGEIDEAMHAGKEPDYGSVAETLDTAMAELSALIESPAAAE